MANNRPLTYTHRIGVRLTKVQREGLRKYAQANETGIGIVLREATLEAIGREDLSLDEETTIRVGNMLHRPRTRRKPDRLHGVLAQVNLTEAQHVAITTTAAERGISASELLRSAGLKRAGIAAAEPERLGRPPGSRNAEG
jgi:hypothetical protein